MKHFISLLVASLLSIGVIFACAKSSKGNPANKVSPVTILVMDSTNALLPDAEVKVGKKIYKTSYDGRIVLRDVKGVRSVRVTCKGYKDKTVPFSPDGTLFVILESKPNRFDKGDRRDSYYSMTSVRSSEGEVKYRTLGDAKADEMMFEEMSVSAAVATDLYSGGVMPNNVSAGKLTAGEVNDFSKWSLWSNVLNTSHKSYVQTWSIAPRERYTVQVTDRHGYPIVNYPVSLTDVNGNTVFQAMTDNTGKAELWNGLTGARANIREPQKSIIVEEPCDLSSDVDVVFVFDATGSMGDELRYLQAEMKDVISRAKDATGGLAIRTGAVVYRDHGDEYITRISRLTEDISVTQTFIDQQRANGGGDYPEAVPEALMAAVNSSGWNEKARARIAFLILDAPCHNDSATLALLHDQILNAAATGVRIVPVVCSGLEESGEYLLRSIALATNGTSFFLTDDSGIGQPHLQPATDNLLVEHLNDMMVRTIVEFSYMPDCTGHWHQEEIDNVNEAFVPNPFEAEDIEKDPAIPHGPTTLYLLDISGKLIYVYEGSLDEAGDAQLSGLSLSLPTGIYFVKAFYDGQWFTKKILVH